MTPLFTHTWALALSVAESCILEIVHCTVPRFCKKLVSANRISQT